MEQLSGQRRDDELELALPFSVLAVRTGRSLVVEFCARHDLPALVEDAELITAELLNNAYLHARSATRLRLSYDGAALHLRVVDRCHRPPQVRAARCGEPGGRGLQIVQALASAWGVQRDGAGKAVWVRLDSRRVPGPGRP